MGGNQDRLRKIEILGVGEMVAEIEVKKTKLKEVPEMGSDPYIIINLTIRIG